MHFDSCGRTTVRPTGGIELVEPGTPDTRVRSEEHTSELQSQSNLVCRLLLDKKNTLTELSSVFDDRFEHWLRIERRPADDVKHVRGGGLLLQRFAQLVEQASVLDHDDGLGGK